MELLASTEQQKQVAPGMKELDVIPMLSGELCNGCPCKYWVLIGLSIPWYNGKHDLTLHIQY